MANVREILEQEIVKWRKEPFQRYLEIGRDAYRYKVERQRHVFDVKVHARVSGSADEILVMIEVSRKAVIGTYIGEARCFVIGRDNKTHDARLDE